MLDSNTHYLNEYEHNQSLLETQWELSPPEKQEAVIAYACKIEAVIAYACKIMEGLVDSEEFAWVFSEYYEDSDFDGDIYVDGFEEALDNWNLGNPPSEELECEMLWKITHSALDGASQSLYNIEFEELFDNLGAAIKEVIANEV
jgi:hypothetical protein